MIIESDSTIEFPELALETVANLEVVETVFDFLQYHHPEITQVNYNSVYVVFRLLPRYIEAEDNSIAAT